MVLMALKTFTQFENKLLVGSAFDLCFFFIYFYFCEFILLLKTNLMNR